MFEHISLTKNVEEGSLQILLRKNNELGEVPHDLHHKLLVGRVEVVDALEVVDESPRVRG